MPRALRALDSTVVWLSVMASIINGQQISHYEYGPPALCGSNFSDFNATGVFNINPNIVQAAQSGQPDNLSGLTQNSSWAVTIANSYGGPDADSELSTSFGAWYNTNGANYSNDLALGYDVCGVVLGFANQNAIYRGQHDDGTCLTTFDAPCKAALETATSTYAGWLVGGNHGTQPNITSTSLPGICNSIAAMLESAVPKECDAYFENPLAFAAPLTTVNDDYQIFLNDSCQINGTYKNVLNFATNSSLPVYTNETQLIIPLLTVFMPVANPAITVTISQSQSVLSCLHIDNINPGSYVPPALTSPASTNNNSGNGLSGGAIAGIVVGVILGIALLATIAFWILRRRQGTQGGGTFGKRPASNVDAKELLSTNIVEAPQGVERWELPGAATKRYEMESMEPKLVGELPGHQPRYELA